MNDLKKEYFKKLTSLCDKFLVHGVREVKTISFVYQVAFKLIEQSSNISYPTCYKYTELSLDKKLARKHQPEVVDVAILLIKVITEDEPFTDLVTKFVEEADVLNKNLAQYFTPSDIAEVLASINNSGLTVDKFEQKRYFSFDDSCGCGTGSMMLAQLRSLKNIKGFTKHHYQSVLINTNDIDEDVSKIAFFQIVLNSIIHHCFIGKVVNMSKNIITEYEQTKNLNLWVLDMNREIEIINLAKVESLFPETESKVKELLAA